MEVSILPSAAPDNHRRRRHALRIATDIPARGGAAQHPIALAMTFRKVLVPAPNNPFPPPTVAKGITH